METITVSINISGQAVERNYKVIDGKAPENMQENIQSMVDTLLDNEEYEG